MSVRTFVRDLQMTPEAIPTVGAIVYNATPADFLPTPERKPAEAVAEKLEIGQRLSILFDRMFSLWRTKELSYRVQVYTNNGFGRYERLVAQQQVLGTAKDVQWKEG